MASRSAIAIVFNLLAGPLLAAAPRPADDVDARAAALVKQMTPDERVSLLHGPMAVSMAGITAPRNVIPGAGHIAGIPRLGIPNLAETDASLGVAWALGQRKDGATALPSGLAMASSWSPTLLREGGAMIAREAHSKGFNVLLAGGVKSEDTARSFMGKLVKDYDLTVVREAITAAIVAQPADAREYLTATCKRMKGERRDPITVPCTDTRADEFRAAMEQRAKDATKPPAEVLALLRRTA